MCQTWNTGKRKVLNLVAQVNKLENFHIYRIFNQDADELSKRDLNLLVGKLVIQEFRNSSLVSEV